MFVALLIGFTDFDIVWPDRFLNLPGVDKVHIITLSCFFSEKVHNSSSK